MRAILTSMTNKEYLQFKGMNRRDKSHFLDQKRFSGMIEQF